MKKIFLKSLFLTVIFVGVFSFFGFVFAQPDLGIEYGVGTGLGNQDIRLTIANIIKVALGLLGIVALAIVLWGGFIWMTAGGNEEKVATAKKILFNGIIGLVIILSSYAITSFIINSLLKATTGVSDHCSNSLIDEGETGLNCGGTSGCGSCGGPPPGGGGDGFFRIVSLPSGGQLCVSNYHPIITFSHPVNLTSVSGMIRILDASSNTIQGSWSLTDRANEIKFSALGDCGDGGTNDCFAKNTPYTIVFYNENNISANNNILSTTDEKKLRCQAVQNGTVVDMCKNIPFITGETPDRIPPTTTILEQALTIYKGDTAMIDTRLEDDVAIQSISLEAGNSMVGGHTFEGLCQKTGEHTFNWNTANFREGITTLSARGFDQAGHVSTTTLEVNILAQHCNNNTLETNLGEFDAGPPACSTNTILATDVNFCGYCDTCANSFQCPSGRQCINGHCTKVTRILGISPNAGTAKIYMAIFGENFGTTSGQVYFSKSINPKSNNLGHWVGAEIVTCGSVARNWSNNQIVVEVPEGFDQSSTGSAIMVIGKGFVINTIGDGSDPNSKKLRFKYDESLKDRPSLCAVAPNTFSSLQNNIEYRGKNFGIFSSYLTHGVYLDASAKLNEDLITMIVNTGSWGNPMTENINIKTISTQAPQVENGSVLTHIVVDGKISNYLRVNLNNTFDSNAPIIDSVSPTSGTKGKYITILGSNFGTSRGTVRFYKKTNNEPITSLNNNDYLVGSFDFMDECLNDIWTDKKIIVKFPEADNITVNQEYAVIVFDREGRSSILRNDKYFRFINTEPKPDVCRIDPEYGPINSPVNIYGENFGSYSNKLKIYFSKQGSDANSLAGRVSSDVSNIFSVRNQNNTATVGQKIVGSVIPGSITGSVLVEREMDDSSSTLSNSIPFTVYDCTKNNNKCLSTTESCCSIGSQKGSCVPSGTNCADTIRSTGYMWRFTTQKFPEVPFVIERCSKNDDTIPSPAPNTALKDTQPRSEVPNVEAFDTCLTADITVAIQNEVDLTTIDNTSFKVYTCTDGPVENSANNFCKTLGSQVAIINLEDKVNIASTTIINASLPEDNNRWTANTWYQVVLTNGIQTEGTRPQKLAIGKPCANVNNSSYCFVFKTGNKDCVLTKVVSDPKNYLTRTLETPVKNRINQNDFYENAKPFYFSGRGISDHCIAMNMRGYSWNWIAFNPSQANIFGSNSKTTTTVSALENTVDVLPGNGAIFQVTASTNTPEGFVSKSGTSSLTIDLSKPEIIDYAPNCFSACPSVSIYARFNLAMSDSPTANKKAELFRCDDGADCQTKIPVSGNFSFSESSEFRNLELNTTLNTNTYYIVKITSGTLFTAPSSTDNTVGGGKAYPYDFVWRFKTMDKVCVPNRISVLPPVFNASFIGDKKIYFSEIFSAPDDCRAEGQKLNAYDYDWRWSSMKPLVATTSPFRIVGKNPFCLANCLKRGSVIASGTYNYNYPMCGNGRLEAGEDCDTPGESGCSMECLFKSKPTKTGSVVKEKLNPLDVNAAECGDGVVSASEDCDIKIDTNASQTSSSMFCSQNCLHTGTQLSAQWCEDNYDDFHGSGIYSAKKDEFEKKCTWAISQCGNGDIEPDEDCESGSNCSKNCLFKDETKKGSSLFDTPSSVCGDTLPSANENTECESNLFGNNNYFAPWVVVKAVGEDFSPETYLQNTQIKAQLVTPAKEATGEFNLICGFNTDAECQREVGPAYGVGKNSCCYLRPNIVNPTYPNNGDTNVCPNTVIRIPFDRQIDLNTLPGNLLIAKQYADTNTTTCNTSTDITGEVVPVAYFDNLPWYKKVWVITVNFLQKVFGLEKATAKWCTGETTGVPTMTYNFASSTFDVLIKLSTQLAGNTTTYKVVIKEGVRDIRGVSVSKDGPLSRQFTFTTWGKPDVCFAKYANVIPTKILFTHSNDVTTTVATVRAENNQLIQTTTFYSWDFSWSKDQSPSFRVDTNSKINSSNVTSLNENGEGDVFVTVSTTKGGKVIGKSHVTVFLCENPWPPFVAGGKTVWPFDDSASNNDYFDFNFDFESTKTGFNGDKNVSKSDKYTNFSTYYCADNGAVGINDDLPYMKPMVSSTHEADVLKYYLLTNDKSADAIGIKIFKNLNYLTLVDWMKSKRLSLEGFNSLKIDGYEAMVDSDYNNIYISALNLSDDLSDSDNDDEIYSNIYLFSLSVGADTKVKEEVFKKMLENLKFNIDLNDNSNRKSCAADGNWDDPDPKSSCNTDLDCLEITDKPLCLNQKEKIQRNYQRLQDMKKISLALSNYENKYPEISETFLTNKAFSVWDKSWNEFGSAIQFNESLPIDPINKLAPAGTCLKSKDTFCTANSACGAIPTGTGLAGYWTGENNFDDNSTRTNTAIGDKVSFAPGIGHGQSFNFSTGYEKITINHREEYNTDLNNFALSFWFKPTEQTPAILFKKGGWSDTATNNTLGGFMVEYDKLSFAGSTAVANNGTIRFAIFPSSTSALAPKQYFAIDSNKPLSLNVWHHILVRYDHNASESSLYLVIDGTAVNTAVKSGNSTSRVVYADNKVPGLQIGQNTENIIVGEGMKGQLDEIYLYSGDEGLGDGLSNLNSKFENICQMHDSQTGWSPEDKRFSFACGEGSMAYGYSKLTENSFNLRMTKETDGLVESVWNGVKSKLELGNSKFIFSNFCEALVITSNKGTCGDGILNIGEICEPGSNLYDTSKCPASATVQSCNLSCAWNDKVGVSCTSVILGSCGDGKTQYGRGETCDDGDGLYGNGKNGKCSGTCQLQTQPVCGNGSLDEGEYCDTEDGVCKFSDGKTRKYEDVAAYFLVDASRSMQDTLSGKTSAEATSMDPQKWAVVTTTLPIVMNELASNNIKLGGAFFTTDRIRYQDSPDSLEERIYLRAGNDPDQEQMCDAGPCRVSFLNGVESFMSYTNNPLNFYEFLDYNYHKINKTKIENLKKYFRTSGDTPTAEAIQIVLDTKFNSSTEPFWKYMGKKLIIVTDGVSDNINKTKLNIEKAGNEGIEVNIFWIGTGGSTSIIANAARNTGGIFKNISSITMANGFSEEILKIIQDKPCQEYNFNSGQSCAWNCNGPGEYCGDGIKNGSEECDDGKGNGDGKSCSLFCTKITSTVVNSLEDEKYCGNDIKEDDNNKGIDEECDWGEKNGSICDIRTGFSYCSWCSKECLLKWNICSFGVADSDNKCVGAFWHGFNWNVWQNWAGGVIPQ